MNPLLQQLHDIDGLDQISAFPLAVGWYILIGIAILLLSSIIVFLSYYIAYKLSWRNEVHKKLDYLEKNLTDNSGKETVITLSEYLRRIAIKRFSREQCASLMGDEWLQWLTKNDPKNFDWQKKGTLLIEVPYAPKEAKISTNQVKDLIHAVRYWVR